MSLSYLVNSLPVEKKREKRVFTLILCGDDEAGVSALHDRIACAPTLTPAQENPVPILPDDEYNEEMMGGYKLPKLFKEAKKMLGSLGSTLSAANTNFADMLGLVDLDKEGRVGDLASVTAKNAVTVCQRTVLTEKGLDWRCVLVHVKVPVPSYPGWKRILHCVCAPSRFPNAMVLLIRSTASIQNNPYHAEGASVYSRMIQIVPIMQVTVSSEDPKRVIEVEGVPVPIEVDGVLPCLSRTASTFPLAQKISQTRLANKLARKKEVRSVIKHSALSAAAIVLIPLPLFDTGTVMLIELRMLQRIAGSYARYSNAPDIRAAQHKLQLMMAPGALALLPLQSVKLVPTGGFFLNIGANALVTFGIGVAAAEIFERLLEHELIFEEDGHRLFRREMGLLKQQASATLNGAKQFAKLKGKFALQKGKEAVPYFSRKISEALSTPGSKAKEEGPVQQAA